MKKGRSPKEVVVWPVYAVKRFKKLGFTEDRLHEALKIGIKTLEVDSLQLQQRVRSINETWNTEAFGALDDQGDSNGSEPGLERESSLDMAEPDPQSLAGVVLEPGLSDAAIGPGQFPETAENITNIEVIRDASV